MDNRTQIMGYSRQQFYEIRRNFQTYRADGLLNRLPGAKGPQSNRFSKEMKQAAKDLALSGVYISSGGVRGVWSSHNLLNKHQRLLRLEQSVREKKLDPSDEQVRALEGFSPEFRERHIQTQHTGDLVAVDTFLVGFIKGVGRIYRQIASTATTPTPGGGPTPPSFRSRRCTCSTTTSCPFSRLTAKHHHDPERQWTGVLRPA